MIPYIDGRGHDWGAKNFDGYGISMVVFGVVYTLFFLAACSYLWLQRHHPLIRMRKVPLVILSLLILHVYLFMVFLVYLLNGTYPCDTEYWIMSLYLPVGIGLFQAQNQQLLIISREQNELMHMDDNFKDESFKPLYGKRNSPNAFARYWTQRTKYHWKKASKQGRYEAIVLFFIIVQVIVTAVIFHISRKFNPSGIVSSPTTPGMCRRGWEWAPSIFWQFAWNYILGPFLLWKIRMIHDIYHWRIQTILAIVAGLPGTPLWLASVYSDTFAKVNLYWVPCWWFAPGLITMELTTLIFPIVQLQKHKRAARETTRTLQEYQNNRLTKSIDSSSTTGGSETTHTTGSKGKMHSMETLEACLKTNCDGLKVYASCMELNGENIIFLTKILGFKEKWKQVFTTSNHFLRARMAVFRAALNIYITLINADTAKYPINIESPIYAKLEEIFGEATTLVASCRRGSSSNSSATQVTPWEESDLKTPPKATVQDFALRDLTAETLVVRSSSDGDGDSTKQFVATEIAPSPITCDPLAGYKIPVEFNANVFDNAYRSIRYMVWSETWQRYMSWNQHSGTLE